MYKPFDASKRFKKDRGENGLIDHENTISTHQGNKQSAWANDHSRACFFVHFQPGRIDTLLLCKKRRERPDVDRCSRYKHHRNDHMGDVDHLVDRRGIFLRVSLDLILVKTMAKKQPTLASIKAEICKDAINEEIDNALSTVPV